MYEQIKAEINKQRKNIDGLFTEGDNSFYDGQDDALYHLLSFIESLEQGQPKGLDKAADDYMYPITADLIRDEPFTQLNKAFKAGANWQVTQLRDKEESLEKEQLQGFNEEIIAIDIPDDIYNSYEHENIIYACKKVREAAFIAGARWQAAQGYTGVGKIIDEIAYDSLQFNELIPNNIFKPNEEVIVQIRKKED